MMAKWDILFVRLCFAFCHCVPESTFSRYALEGIALVAECLVVLVAPKQLHVAFVSLDVIGDGCCYELASVPSVWISTHRMTR